VLDLWERFVEVVKQRFPFLVLGRLAETLRMAFNRVPPNEEEILSVMFSAAPKLVSLVSRDRGNDTLSHRECFLKLGRRTNSQVQDRYLKHHGSPPRAQPRIEVVIWQIARAKRPTIRHSGITPHMAFLEARAHRADSGLPRGLWAQTQNNLGAVLGTLRERESGTEHLNQAVNACEQALMEYTSEAPES
jgi:hypothetical protein